MVTNEQLISLLSKTKSKIEIIGIRGLVKVKESEWSFRYTYRKKNDDFLSISGIMKYDSIKKKLIIKKYYGSKKKILKKINH